MSLRRWAVVALTALLVLAGTWLLTFQPGAHGSRIAHRGLASLPVAAWGPASAAVGRDEPDYRVVGLRAANRGQRLRLAFSRAGVTVMSGRERVLMALSGVGYAGAMRSVSDARPVAGSNRVAYAHRGVREWYANGPLGLEQGFDVLSRPTEGRGPLTLSVAMAGGLRPLLDQGQVLLADRGVRLRYGGLVVTDARGRALRSWLAVRAGGVEIRADDRGARYPLRIDPLIQQGSKLTGSGEVGSTSGPPGGEFGSGVAVSSDGNTALIGGETDNGGLGAAWVFTRSGTTWTQQGPKLTGSGEIGNGSFGDSVALSSDGNTALIGGRGDNGGVGAAWVFTRSGTTWTQQGPKLTGSGGISQPFFGRSVALSSDGNTGLIGGDADNFGVGAAWVFTRSSATWTQQGPKLTASETGTNTFGASVALSSDGNTALIGGSGDHGGAGAAWVFTRSGTTWTQQGPELAGGGESGTGTFGISVALSSDGNTALIGGELDNGSGESGAGAAWVFTRSGTTWTQQGPKLTGLGESGSGNFGGSVALSADGNTALIGGFGDNHYLGAAWVFTRSGTTWTQQGSKLTGSGEIGNGLFGASVALSATGDTALIGGLEDNSFVGAAWVFVPGWTLTVSLGGTGFGSVASDPAGISCPGTCSYRRPQGTALTLTASPAQGSTFGGWSGGGCSASRTCTVTLNSDQTITARFNAGLGTLQLGGAPTATATGVRFRLRCNATAGQRCQSSNVLTSTENLKGGKPTAISATQPRKRKRTVVVGRKRVTITAGTFQTITLSLNPQGRRLLKRFHKLPATLKIALTKNGKMTTSLTRRLTIKQKQTKHAALLAWRLF